MLDAMPRDDGEDLGAVLTRLIEDAAKRPLPRDFYDAILERTRADHAQELRQPRIVTPYNVKAESEQGRAFLARYPLAERAHSLSHYLWNLCEWLIEEAEAEEDARLQLETSQEHSPQREQAEERLGKATEKRVKTEGLIERMIPGRDAFYRELREVMDLYGLTGTKAKRRGERGEGPLGPYTAEGTARAIIHRLSTIFPNEARNTDMGALTRALEVWGSGRGRKKKGQLGQWALLEQAFARWPGELPPDEDTLRARMTGKPRTSKRKKPQKAR
jgi:hypothetical protein